MSDFYRAALDSLLVSLNTQDRRIAIQTRDGRDIRGIALGSIDTPEGDITTCIHDNETADLLILEDDGTETWIAVSEIRALALA